MHTHRLLACLMVVAICGAEYTFVNPFHDGNAATTVVPEEDLTSTEETSSGQATVSADGPFSAAQQEERETQLQEELNKVYNPKGERSSTANPIVKEMMDSVTEMDKGATVKSHHNEHRTKHRPAQQHFKAASSSKMNRDLARVRKIATTMEAESHHHEAKSDASPITFVGKTKAILDVCRLPQQVMLQGSAHSAKIKSAETNLRFALREAKSYVCGAGAPKVVASPAPPRASAQEQAAKTKAEHQEEKKEAVQSSMLKKAFAMLAHAQDGLGKMQTIKPKEVELLQSLREYVSQHEE